MTTVTHPIEKPAVKGSHRGSAVQSMFDRIAGTYDILNDCISFGMHRGWKKKAVKALQLQRGQHVLDVCTGTGDLVSHLKQAVGESGQVTGLDFSGEMLDVAKERFGSENNIHFKQGDALKLPYADNTFDGAIVAFGLRNVENISQAVSEMHRVVKPGGRVVNLDTCPEPKLPGFWLYFSIVMPIVGKLLSTDPVAYKYLFESTKAFVSPEEMADIFKSSGLKNVTNNTLAVGSVMLQSGQKTT